MGWRDAFDVPYLRHLHGGGGVEHVWPYGIVSHSFSLNQSEDSFLTFCAQWFERRCSGVSPVIVLSSHKCNRTVFGSGEMCNLI